MLDGCVPSLLNILRIVRVFLLLAWFLPSLAAADDFRFVLLGDRTGEAQPGIYEQVWKNLASEKPAFVVSPGDTIQGLNDATAAEEWRQVRTVLSLYTAIPLYLTPGNHDVWSESSELLFAKNAGHPVHYSFDSGPVHVTVLDNSRGDSLSPDEMAFLERDLQAHADRPVKFIVSHRPSWLFPVLLRSPDFPLHQLAKKYGVQYVIAGHVHQLLHFSLEGVEYVSLPSAGGHLRSTGKYEDGWFFGFTVAEVRKQEAGFAIELKLHPLGGVVTNLSQWGSAGLLGKP